jgi:hypothetical protein
MKSLNRKEEQEEAATWILDAFKKYSEKFADDGEMEVPVRTEMQQYGEDFSRIIRDHVGADLGQDLFDLKTNECPALAIVELIVLCTSGFRFTIPDALALGWHH